MSFTIAQGKNFVKVLCEKSEKSFGGGSEGDAVLRPAQHPRFDGRLREGGFDQLTHRLLSKRGF
jgi:hypothetical protein